MSDIEKKGLRLRRAGAYGIVYGIVNICFNATAAFTFPAVINVSGGNSIV